MFAAVIACAAAAGCSQVIESVPIEQSALGYTPTCHSALGAYYLPRALLKLKVTAQESDITPPLVTTTMIADRSQPFCLDYLAAANSDDIVVASRNVQGLLTKISSNVTDKTPQIVESLIQTAENIAIQAGRQAGVAQPKDTLDLEFDPFVWEELLMAKTALRRFGYCLYVEGYSFPVYNQSAAALRSAGERWCATEHPARFSKGDDFASLPVPAEVGRTGILYRPNIAHRIVVLRKQDPGGHGPWQLLQSLRFEMPNASPVLSVGVSRTMFAQRQTTINFDNGILTDVAINKGSELVGFVSIPLQVAKAIVDVPAQIIKIRISDTNNQTALLNAQGALIQELTAYQNLVNSQGATAGAAGAAKSAPDRAAAVFGACRNGGGPIDDCASIARSGL